MTYPGSAGRPTHAFHYAPRNAHSRGPDGAAPPLVVMLHGGPTSMMTSTLRAAAQFWTTRGSRCSTSTTAAQAAKDS